MDGLEAAIARRGRALNQTAPRAGAWHSLHDHLAGGPWGLPADVFLRVGPPCGKGKPARQARKKPP
eukprot:6065417-Lingulodinium_polyedra.AAC.1